MPLKRVKVIVLLAIAAAVLALPILVWGPVFIGQDTRQHLFSGRYFAEQFWRGELYPRWLLNMNDGLGSATLFIYPPLPSYVYALLLPIAKIIHLNAFSLGEYFCLLASALGAFLWMTTIASRRVALIVATIYLLLPYHLVIDFYRRDALAECWALAWIPFVMYFTTLVVRKKRYATVGLALSYALFILSHLISVLMLSALPLLLVLTIAERGQKARAFFTVVGCFALGAAVSGAYLVPALATAKYFPVARTGVPIDNGPNGNLLIYGWRLLTGHSGKTKFLRAVSLSAVDTTLFIALCGFMALRKGPRGRRGQTLLWLAVCPIPLFMMSGPSLPVWRALPLLGSALQFPWRLGVVLCVAALPLAAFLLTDIMELSRRSRIGILAVIFLFAATWFGGYVDVVRRLTPDHYDAGASVRIHDGWFAAWTPPGMDQERALAASTGPAARFLAGDGAATVLVWKARHIEVRTDCTACGPLEVKQLYFPMWKARLVPSGEPLPVEPALPEGLLSVQPPPGQHRILLEIPVGIEEHIGNWLSALGLFACCLLAAFQFDWGRKRFTPAHCDCPLSDEL